MLSSWTAASRAKSASVPSSIRRKCILPSTIGRILGNDTRHPAVRPVRRRASASVPPSMASCPGRCPRASKGRRAMTYRVIQWATGGVGEPPSRACYAHPDSNWSAPGSTAASEGRRSTSDAARRLDPIGVRATDDIDALLPGRRADCVIYSPLWPTPTRARGASCDSGKNVVTPVGWVYPPPTPGPRSTPSRREAGVTLHGTGIHPGGVTERFPLMVSALSNADHLRAGRGVLRHPDLRRARRGARLMLSAARPRRPGPASWPS